MRLQGFQRRDIDRLLAAVLLASLVVELAVSDEKFSGVWPFNLVSGSVLALSVADNLLELSPRLPKIRALEHDGRGRA